MSAAAGSTSGLLSGASQPHAQKPFRFDLRRDLIRIGMVGLGPYSHAMMYTEPLNHPDYPPRTNMRVTAVWGKEDGYRSSYIGTDEQIEQKVRNLSSYMSIDKFTKELGVEHVVMHPEDMLGKVDAVFITDPEDSLNLARPFLEAGIPVFLNRPIAWNVREISEILRLAKENDSPLVTGSCVPWMQEIQVVAHRTKDCMDSIQQYYVEGSGANFCSYFSHIIETALKLVPGRIERCWCFGPEADPDIDPAGHVTVAHYEYAKTGTGREPVLGTVTNSYEKPYRCWAKIVFRDDLWFKGKRICRCRTGSILGAPGGGTFSRRAHIASPAANNRSYVYDRRMARKRRAHSQ